MYVIVCHNQVCNNDNSYSLQWYCWSRTHQIQWSGQNSQILLCRNHYHSSVKQGGTITFGRSAAVKFHDGSLTRVIALQIPSISCLTLLGQEIFGRYENGAFV